MRTLLSAICLLAILANMPASAQRVSQTAPAPNRIIGAPNPQRPGVDHPEGTGTIEGFVYWDTKHFSHVSAGSCSGLAVTVGVGSSSGGPLVAYTKLVTLTNNFKYAGQVKEFVAGGKVNVYNVCTYAYGHVPVGPDLQVELAVTQPGVFSPVAVPQFAVVGPIKIIDAQCNMLPRITNPSMSDLVAHWGSCQNMAYDVNFVMHTAPRPPLGNSGSGGLTSGPQRGMLSNSPQQGMIEGTGSSTTQSQSGSGELLVNKRSTPATAATTAPASRIELNPQTLPRMTAGAGTATPGTKVALKPQRTTIPSPGCTVSQLQLRFRTGRDDLRGGDNNLDVETHFANGDLQTARNVNQGANWPNNSINVATIHLSHAVSPSEISQIRLVHSAKGGFSPNRNPASPEISLLQGIKSEDNWDMAEFQAFGLGSGINVPIASFGSHRFTGSYPSLDINAQAAVGCPAVNQVSKISFTFSTGDDDLRGGNDNLDITIHFADGTTQSEPNVNHGESWPDGSRKGAEVLLNRAVTIDQIRSITLSDTFTGGAGGDNWNMNSMQADAWVDGTYHTIAKYGFHRFSADWSGEKSRDIEIPTHAIN